MKTSRKSSPTAFTLVEIAVVLAIVGIVTALLFPIFSSVRENACRTSCASNLKQIGKAVSMYTQDYDGRVMPVLHETVSVDGNPALWFRLLYSYSKDQQIFRCPSDDTGTFENYGGWASYGYNAHIGGASHPEDLPTGTDVSSQNISQIARPAATVLITDSGTVASTNHPGFEVTPPEEWDALVPCPAEIGDASVLTPVPPSGSGTGYVPTSIFPAPRARHRGRTSVLWADGHVTSAKIESFFVLPGTTAHSNTIAGYSPCMRPEKGCL